jgi:hypothetical protein
MTIDLVAELVLQALHEILRRDRTERLAGLAGLEGESDAQLADPASELFRFVQLRRFARRVSLSNCRAGACSLRDFVGFALGQKIIARVTAAHFDDIRLGAEAGDVFGENDFSGRHAPRVSSRTANDFG